jgi:AraC-like DNA-binding protein
MGPERGVSVGLLRPLALSVKRLGASSEEFLETLGITPTCDDTRYVPADCVAQAVADVAKIVGERHIGLALARATPFGNLSFIDYCAISSGTLGLGLRRTARYYALLTSRARLAIGTRDGLAVVSQEVAPRRAPIDREITELAFGIIHLRAKEGLGGSFRLTEVSFTHDGDATRTHAEFFGAPVRFGAGRNEMVFPEALLDKPMQSANAALAETLEAHASRLQQKLERAEDTFVDAARNAISARIADDPSLAEIADALDITSRTLQRRLAERKLSFSAVVDDVRREMALVLVERGDVSMLEVAFELGFSEPATLYRAFRRWTGTTPAEFRSRQSP